jgi:hypothetical protein
MTFGQNNWFGMGKPNEWIRYIDSKILNWEPTGRRKRGRPKTKRKEGVLRATE